MKHQLPMFAALALSVMGGVFTPAAKADEWNKKTNITINQAILVEGTVLPAGSYVIKLVDLPAERDLVQILSAAQDHVFATVFTVPAYRTVPADNSEFKFYTSESGQTPALHTWFYPGDQKGFEFRPSRGGAASESAATANTMATGAPGN